MSIGLDLENHMSQLPLQKLMDAKAGKSWVSEAKSNFVMYLEDFQEDMGSIWSDRNASSTAQYSFWGGSA